MNQVLCQNGRSRSDSDEDSFSTIRFEPDAPAWFNVDGGADFLLVRVWCCCNPEGATMKLFADARWSSDDVPIRMWNFKQFPTFQSPMIFDGRCGLFGLGFGCRRLFTFQIPRWRSSLSKSVFSTWTFGDLATSDWNTIVVLYVSMKTKPVDTDQMASYRNLPAKT